MRVGSLFTGYSGIEMSLSLAGLDVDLAWVSDIDEGACKIVAHRHPGVPNLGDITAVEWSQVEPVDVLTGGFPCQDVSSAGRQAGLRPGTRSGLWVHMAHAIDQLRPALVVAENVRGLLSAEAASDVEPCPWCVGDDPSRVVRALGTVLGDLADIGYDARWCGLRAADVGAPHGRFRVFLVAHPQGERHQWSGAPRTGWAGPADGGGVGDLLPTPRATDGTKGGPNQRGSSGDLMLPSAVYLLPTPTATPYGRNQSASAGAAVRPSLDTLAGSGALLPTPRVTQPGYADDGRGGRSLDVEARLLPTPVTEPDTGNGHARNLGKEARGDQETTWGDYAAAIGRWESLTRPAPTPTERDWDKWRARRDRRLASRLPVGRRGSIRFIHDGPPERLSPAFVEWMMGLPAGWVTDVPGVTRNEALRALGNGVVPQQAAAALSWLLASEVAA